MCAVAVHPRRACGCRRAVPARFRIILSANVCKNPLQIRFSSGKSEKSPQRTSLRWGSPSRRDAIHGVSPARGDTPAPAFFPRVGHAGRGRRDESRLYAAGIQPRPAFFPCVGHAGRERRDKSRLYAADTPAAAGVVTRWRWHFFNTENAIFSSARSFARKYAKIRKT